MSTKSNIPFSFRLFSLITALLFAWMTFYAQGVLSTNTMESNSFIESHQKDSTKQNYYIPLTSDNQKFDQLIDTLSIITAQRNKDLKEKELKEAFKSILAYQESLKNSNFILFDTVFYPLANKVLSRLKAANPDYSKFFSEVLISKSRVANAYSMGNGVFLVNLGLISRMTNEDQLAALLGHEYGHYILKHTENRILAKKAHENEKSTKKSYRSIKKGTISQSEQYENYILGNKIVYRAISRKAELAADSFSILLLTGTEFNKTGAIELLEILDLSDQEKYKDSIDFSVIFSKGTYTFNSNLLLNKDGMQVEEKFDEELANKLKTHPECKDRIAKLKLRDSFPSNNNVINHDPYFDKITELADFEMILYDYEMNRFARCIKNSLLQKKSKPYNSFLDVLVGICLGEIYQAQKNHKLWDYIPRPDDNYSFNYQRILLIIDNIRLHELKELSLSYMDDILLNVSDTAIQQNEHLAYLFLLSYKIKNDILSEKQLLEYQNEFPKSIYNNNLNNN